MSDQNNSLKLFTLEEANATLPLIRAITRDIIGLSTQMFETKQRLELLFPGSSEEKNGPKFDDPNCGALYQEELEDIQYSLEADGEKLRRFVDELLALGVEPKGLTEGLVDFPSIHNDEVIYLCWQFDEPEITHWHRIEEGFSGRKKIDHKNFDTQVLFQDAPF